MLPQAVRVAVLVNPSNVKVIETKVQKVKKAAPTIGLQTDPHATTIGEIHAAFATNAQERNDDTATLEESIACHKQGERTL
jgi:hypothetical protein